MKIFLFPILILLISCSDKKSEPEKSVIVLEENWTELNTRDSIPELFTLAIKKVLQEGFEIANPNEKFNATDIKINDSIPTKQLRLLSRKNDIWRLAYIQGGIGKHYVFMESKITNESISNFRISQTNLELENNDSIDKYLANKKLEPIEIKVIMD